MLRHFLAGLAVASAGVALALPARAQNGDAIAVMTSYQDNQWQIVTAPPFSAVGVAGENKFGPIIFGGEGNRQVAILQNYSGGDWTILPPAPFAIRAIAGDNQHGPIICGGNGRQVAILQEYRRAQWQELAPAPFDIHGISGENSQGPIVWGGNNREIAVCQSYRTGTWKLIAPAPFEIRKLCGNNIGGPAIVGGRNGREIAHMDSYANNTWTMAGEVPFAVQSLSGENSGGLIAAGGGQIAILQHWNQGWQVLAQPPITLCSIAGTNSSGPIALGHGEAAAEPPPPPPPPPPPQDTTPPTVQIVDVEDGFVCHQETLTVLTRAWDDMSGVRGVRINGVEARQTERTGWSATIRLAAGQNQIVAEAFDYAGNCGRAEVSIAAKWSPPQVTVRVQTFTVIDGEVDDPSAQVWVEGQQVEVEGNGHFRAQVAVPANGHITVIAKDRYGLESRTYYNAQGQRVEQRRGKEHD